MINIKEIIKITKKARKEKQFEIEKHFAEHNSEVVEYVENEILKAAEKGEYSLRIEIDNILKFDKDIKISDLIEFLEKQKYNAHLNYICMELCIDWNQFML
jgi:hypothetical protein